jgi:branched-subunit amino acid transport protein AzlD
MLLMSPDSTVTNGYSTTLPALMSRRAAIVLVILLYLVSHSDCQSLSDALGIPDIAAAGSVLLSVLHTMPV